MRKGSLRERVTISNTVESSSERDSGYSGDDSDESYAENNHKNTLISFYLLHRDRRRQEKRGRFMDRSAMRVQRRISVYTFLDDGEVKRTYRMSRCLIEKLCCIVAPLLSPMVSLRCAEGREEAGNSVGSLLEKVLISLRMLAGASYLNLKLVHGLAESTLYTILRRFYYAVSSLASFHTSLLRIYFPEKTSELEMATEGFQTMRCLKREVFGCVAALDGLAIRINRPSQQEANNIKTYYSRNGFFSVNLLATCELRLLFTFSSMETPGSTHNSSAFLFPKFRMDWVERQGDEPFYMAADEA